MQSITPRAGRRSLAESIVILTATAVFGACVDETTAPAPSLNAPPRAEQAETAAPNPEQTKVELTILDKRVVFNTSTGYASVRAAVSCSAYETFDVILEMHQEQKNGTAWSTVSGASTFENVTCTDGSSSFTLLIAPQSGAYVSGNATVTARIANYQPRVTPTEVRRRVRVST